MTTKHVVADGAFGQLSRRLWEVQRRVLEGTLNPDNVCNNLQKIIEGTQSGIFQLEETNYIVGERSYPVRVLVTNNLLARVNNCSNVTRNFYKDRVTTECYEVFTTFKPHAYKRRLRLAKVVKLTNFDVLQTQAEINGHILADEWDLLAFVEQAPVMRVVHNDMVIRALGGCSINRWWKESGQLRRSICLGVYGVLRGVSGDGWKLESSEHACFGGLGNRGGEQYLLLRDK